MINKIDFLYISLKILLNKILYEKELCYFKLKYIKNKSILTNNLKFIIYLPFQLKYVLGHIVNYTKIIFNHEINNIENRLKNNLFIDINNSYLVEPTLINKKFKKGKYHPINYTIKLIQDIFISLGFILINDNDISSEWNNFLALNIDINHIVRNSHDTFYLKNKKLMLRTHTSSEQIRYMSNNYPPLRFITIGKVYRVDYDTTHIPIFHQVEGVVLNKKINIENLKFCIKRFLELFFSSKNVSYRLRSSYFPFTIPSFEVDINNNGKWLEVLGCGLVDKKVLINAGINYKKYHGFAFGIGVERLAMLKFDISDIREFYNMNVDYIQCYGV